MSQAREETAALVSALDLEAHLNLSTEDPTSLLKAALERGHPIFLTGRLETYKTLRVQYPNANLIGATGRCAVLLTTKREATQKLEAALFHARLERSCSNISHVIECDWSDEGNRVHGVWPPLKGASRLPLRIVLRKLHPSVLYSFTQDTTQSIMPKALGGYTIIACEQDGSPHIRSGFAADPVAGWPGDYLL